MWRIPFLIYCVACWELFLFYPWPAVNLLMIGVIVVGRWRERARDSAAAAGELDTIESARATRRSF